MPAKIARAEFLLTAAATTARVEMRATPVAALRQRRRRLVVRAERFG
jgi:hypothetical protein